METAPYDFNFALSKTKQSDPNKAFHLIQSFAPGEVSYDEAHRIGIELADKLLEGKYSYVISTHIDKGHIHSHIIFCAADNIEHKKYNDCKRTYYHIRELSDTLCKEHNLSVINPSQNKGKRYNLFAFSVLGLIPILLQIAKPSRIAFIVVLIIAVFSINLEALPALIIPAERPAATA